jgi:hypothetical protein
MLLVTYENIVSYLPKNVGQQARRLFSCRVQCARYRPGLEEDRFT